MPQWPSAVDAKEPEGPTAILGRDDFTRSGVPVAKEGPSAFVGVGDVEAPSGSLTVRMPAHVTPGRVPEVAARVDRGPGITAQCSQLCGDVIVEARAGCPHGGEGRGERDRPGIDKDRIADLRLESDSVDVASPPQDGFECFLRHRGASGVEAVGSGAGFGSPPTLQHDALAREVEEPGVALPIGKLEIDRALRQTSHGCVNVAEECLRCGSRLPRPRESDRTDRHRSNPSFLLARRFAAFPDSTIRVALSSPRLR